jgi:hypothetical protein
LPLHPLLGPAILSVREFAPYDNHSEAQQNGIEHTDGSEFEPGNLIIGPEPIQANATADDDRADSGDQRRQSNEEEAFEPQRKISQKNHACLE